MSANLENSAVATGLENVSFRSNPKERQSQSAQTTTQLHSLHTLVTWYSKFSKPGFNSTWTMKFQMFKLGLEKNREARDQIANLCWIIKKAREFQKNIYFCFINYAKSFDCVDHKKLWKILKAMGSTRLADLPPEKSVCRSRSNS